MAPAKLARDVVAAEIGQRDIEKHELGIEGSRDRDRLETGASGTGRLSEHREQRRDALSGVAAVVDDQHAELAFHIEHALTNHIGPRPSTVDGFSTSYWQGPHSASRAAAS